MSTILQFPNFTIVDMLALKSFSLHEFQLNLGQMLFSNDAWWWIEQEQCKLLEENERKNLEKLREFWDEKLLDLKKWIVVIEFCYDYTIYTPN